MGPTVLGALGYDRPGWMNGADLSPLFDGKQPPRRRWRTAAYNDHVNVRDGRWLLIADNQGRSKKLYDTKADPGERRNVAARHPDQVRRLWGYIKRDAGNRPLPKFKSVRRGWVDASSRSGCPRPGAPAPGGRGAPGTSRSASAG